MKQLNLKTLRVGKNVTREADKKILRMAITLLLSVTVVVISMQSCSNNDDLSEVATVESQKANMIAAEYLELLDNQYVLNLSEKEATALGISKSDYTRMQKEVRQTNEFIIDCQKKGIDVDINDPKKAAKLEDEEIDLSTIRLKSGVEAVKKSFYLRFSISPISLSGTGSAFAPLGLKQIQITVLQTCLVGSCSGTINCGGVERTFSIIKNPFSGGSTTATLPMSNCNVTIKARTLCSDGGTVTASGSY